MTRYWRYMLVGYVVDLQHPESRHRIVYWGNGFPLTLNKDGKWHEYPDAQGIFKGTSIEGASITKEQAQAITLSRGIAWTDLPAREDSETASEGVESGE